MHDTLAMTRLILVEDDAGLRDQLKWALRENFEVLEADSLAAAKELAAEGGAPIVCLDLGLEGRADRGLEIIDAILSADRAAKIVVITGQPDGALAREAIRRGAFDFLEKPLDVGKLEAVLDRALRLRSLESVPDEPPSWTPVAADQPMLGESQPMKNLFATLHRLAQTDVNVLITGESGTGKELCARALHEGGPRARHPFVPVHCGAIPEALLEAELFGHAKGAFPGADEDKAGLLETAHRGTVFFDEIGDMPPALQVKLLRFLQDKRLQRIGEGKSRVLDVRVVAATNRPILTGSDGALRSDLYYRLSEFEVRVPPLRERGRDVLILAEAILEKNRARFGRPRLRLSSRAEKALLAHGWPGNVRELENRLNRASIVAEGNVIEDADLELDGSGDATQSYREARKQFEKNLLLNALRRANGNVSLAARTVGVTRPTFYDMMRKTGIWVRAEAKAEGGEAKA
jgi:two-component system NtrC family response regulator